MLTAGPAARRRKGRTPQAAGEPGLAGGRCCPAASRILPASQPPLLLPPAPLHPGGLCGGARLQERHVAAGRAFGRHSQPSNKQQWGNRHTSGSAGAVPVLACKAYRFCPCTTPPPPQTVTAVPHLASRLLPPARPGYCTSSAAPLEMPCSWRLRRRAASTCAAASCTTSDPGAARCAASSDSKALRHAALARSHSAPAAPIADAGCMAAAAYAASPAASCPTAALANATAAAAAASAAPARASMAAGSVLSSTGGHAAAREADGVAAGACGGGAPLPFAPAPGPRGAPLRAGKHLVLHSSDPTACPSHRWRCQ